jgi:UDP-N-acetylglucosamine/UDP-N-acetylgalactosamine diphosphorylase
MASQKKSKISQLINKGVRIACPDGVEIGDEVEVDNISGEDVVVHAGSKIFGDATLILRGARIGLEAPATIMNCQIGPEVELKGGFFQDAVFLAKAKAGLGSHVREATILEEQASIAHTVGTKHTILFPFVTLGSLINFCDCLMAGGTSRQHHSEVGSAYIHFNFTPNQDKATASLIGDVPAGVMLKQRPIFLGGQGGLVGPCRLAYGTTVAAGTIVRKDELRPGRLLFGGQERSGNLPYTPGRYRTEKRVAVNNIVYIANLIALNHWYCQVRALFVSEDFPEALLAGLKEKLNRAISERVNRLGALGNKIQKNTAAQKNRKGSQPSRALQQIQELYQNWPQLEDLLKPKKADMGASSLRDRFVEEVQQAIERTGLDYISVIQNLDPSAAAIGTRWLQGIVDQVTNDALNLIPSFK